MIYPKFVKNGDTIGVTAPSDGRTKAIDLKRLDKAKENFNRRGFTIIETPNVRSSQQGRSSSNQERVKQLLSLYLNKEVSWIISSNGGDFLMEILPDIDWEIITSNVKWFQGFSDNTFLTYTITTNFDIATIYGTNIGAFGMKDWHESLINNLKVVEGKLFSQTNYKEYQSGFIDYKTGEEGYQLDSKVEWLVLTGEDSVSFEGRLMGGCLDVLLNIVGTKYDKTKEFIEKYKSDGIVWYLENCELSSESLIRGLLQLREAGWFDRAKGFIFGRTLTRKSFYDIPYEEALFTILGKLGVPIIVEADFGHLPPQMTIINGSYAKIKLENGEGEMRLEFKN